MREYVLIPYISINHEKAIFMLLKQDRTLLNVLIIVTVHTFHIVSQSVDNIRLLGLNNVPL